MDSQAVYRLRSADVYTHLQTSPEGIASGEIAARQGLYGKNILVEEAQPALWRKPIEYLFHPAVMLLWIAGGLALLARQPVIALVITALVVVNAGLSYAREHRTAQAMQALRAMLPVFARVVRAGIEASIPASQVVPGDVLLLAEGDRIPADARVVEEYGLRVNHAVLTGEAVSARRTADASISNGISEIERPNLVFAGTSVAGGTGKAVVYATGGLTQFGRIAHLTQTLPELQSPIQLELASLTRRISFLAVAIGAFVFVAGVFDVHLPVNEAFLLALGIIVALVPEGLPAAVTLSLAIAGQRLAQQGILVKRLSLIETLGKISMLCTDKSGTLTQNEMTVREVWVAGQRLRVSGVGYEPRGKFTPAPTGKTRSGDLQLLLAASLLCNNARLSPPSPERPRWTFLGDQTEAALRVVALKGGVSEAELHQALPRIHELPFDARRKRMSTIHQIDSGSGDWLNLVKEQPAKEIAFIKGAPREVLQLCTHIQFHDQQVVLDAQVRSQILETNDRYARQALRVLALAYRKLPARHGAYTAEAVEQDLVFLGLAAMHDPPRPEVAETIRAYRQAGVRLVIITGDYGLTAEALARRIGMLETDDPQILTGAELKSLTDEQLQPYLESEVIFARMSPEDKLRLVAAFQARGEIVAVTGDGVNDAPALRKADIGISMGRNGTDVAREAAGVILTNDNFAALIKGLEEGRAFYDNIRKTITYILSSNVPEILPFLFAAFFNLPLALTVIQILAIDLWTDLIPGLALGSEKPEPDILQRRPRLRSQPIVDGALLRRAFLWLGLIETGLAFTGYFLAFRLEGYTHLAVTLFFSGVVLSQVGNVFACRTETNRGRSLGWFSNPMIWLGVGTELVLIMIIVYVPSISKVFDTQPLPAKAWLWLAFYAPLVYSLDWIRKWIVRRRR